jgi:hypothetical protein
MAYRVESPPYKIELDETARKITGFKGSTTDPTISISFVMPEHSDYFCGERLGKAGLRTVTFEITDDCWAAIQWKAGSIGKGEVTTAWVKRVDKLKAPSWSDGASLSTFAKKTALTFSDGWLDALLPGVKKDGTARADYPEDDEADLKDTDTVWAYYPKEEGESDDEAGPAVGFEAALGEARAAKQSYMTLAKAVRLHYKDEDKEY